MRMPTRWRLWWLMAVVALAAVGLFVGREFVPGWVESFRDWRACRPIHATLGRPLALKLPAGISLDKMLTAVTMSSRSKDLPGGIPIFIDPVSLQEVGADMNTPVEIPDRGAPLGESLGDALRRLNLAYVVRDGKLFVVEKGSLED